MFMLIYTKCIGLDLVLKNVFLLEISRGEGSGERGFKLLRCNFYIEIRVIIFF